MNTWYVIPARKDSKGVPFKNRKLFNYTAKTIPSELASMVYVSTNDKKIIDEADTYGFQVRLRSDELADDHASMKDVLIDVLAEKKIDENDDIVLLYLTYPQRTWDDIVRIYDFFKSNKATAVSCCLDVADHPYLCFQQYSGNRGKPIINHNFYRRQDYPECFRLSLFVAIFKAYKIRSLNDLLVCPETIFYKLPKEIIDIDNEIDMINFKKENGS